MAECVSVLQRIEINVGFTYVLRCVSEIDSVLKQMLIIMMLDADTDVDSLCQGLNESTQTIASVCVSQKVDQKSIKNYI
jgi:hypothetical protein